MNIKIASALYSPVIPNEKIFDFNTSFWANLISSGITGIITGIIVGIVLFTMQNRKQKNDEKQIAMLEFNKILIKLKYLMMKSDFLLFNTKSVDCLYSNVHESILYLMEQPIHYIEDKLNDSYKKELIILKNAISSYQEFMPIADALDNYVIQALLTQGDTNALYDLKNDCGIIFALINGETSNAVKNRFYMNEEKLSFVESVMENEEIVHLTNNYKTYRTKFLDKMYELEEMFDI